MHSGLIAGKYFKLHANCIPVKGASRSVICDLQRDRFHFIPNDLYDIIVHHEGTSILNLLAIYGTDNKETLEEYLNFLYAEEYLFFCDLDELSLFPKLNLRWENPSVITNAIIDINSDSEHDFSSIFKQLEDLGCKALQFRFFTKITLVELSEILILLNFSCITSLEIILPYCEDVNDEDVIAFAFQHFRISSMVIHSCPSKKTLHSPHKASASICFTSESITDESHCGAVSSKYFTLNLSTFTEAYNYNSCLNRKISVDKLGEIKNCPSMGISYGNIKLTNLQTAINTAGFTDIWAINKDQVDVCKDCEFRYICTDCRAYTLDNRINSKPSKCNYNPYKGVWE